MDVKKIYIGTKVVKARERTLNQSQADKDQPSAAEDREGYEVTYEDGYISWSPKDVFERCYREITALEKRLIAVTKYPVSDEG